MEKFITLFLISQRIHWMVEGVFGGSFLKEHTQVRGQSNMEEVVFQEQIIRLKAWDTRVFSLFCCRLPAGPEVNRLFPVPAPVPYDMLETRMP